MATERLEDLAEALRATLVNSQEKLDRQLAGQLSKTITLNSQGLPESISWQCLLPTGDGGKRNLTMLCLPIDSLYPAEPLEISEISIDLVGKIKKSARSTQEEVTLYPCHHDEQAGSHHIKFCVTSATEHPSVSIDGESCEQFLAKEFAPEKRQQQKRKNRRRTLIILLLLTLLLGAVLVAGYLFNIDIRSLYDSLEKQISHRSFGAVPAPVHSILLPGIRF